MKTKVLSKIVDDKIPAVAYMRYSSNNQDEESIKYQRSAIMTYAFTRGYHIATEYIDEARTGTNDRRAEFQRLLGDARNKPTWSKILVYDLSRFSRNNNDATKYLAELEDLDIEVVSVTQTFDDSNEGLLSRGITNLLNEYYSRNLSKHTHSGLQQKAKDAKHCGGKAPLGYNVGTEEKLVINEEEAELVKLIFDLYEANYSYNKMARELNNRGYKTKTGQAFTKNSFSSILTQRKYIGTYTWNKARKKTNKGTRNSHKYKPDSEQIIIYDAIPAIIGKEQFDRVQAMIASRKNGTSASKSRRYYLLSGIGKLKCAECGAYLVGTARRSHGIEYIYYSCPNHKRHTCSVKEIRADYLNEFVVRAVVKDIYNREDLADIFNSIDDKDKIVRLRDKLRGLDKATKNILTAMRRDLNNELQDELKQISEEKANIKLELDRLTKKQLLMTDENRKKICYKIAKMMLSSESLEVKQYLAHAIDSIVVSNDNVELTLNIA